MDRKEKIIEEIKNTDKPISATKLAQHFGVSRQVIVGDIALLRAKGVQITATPRGYILDQSTQANHYTIAVRHDENQLADELYTIVDMGGSILDVIVEHPIYGQLSGKLHIHSRYDVNVFLEKVEKEKASSLSLLTKGLHFHTIQCPNNEIYQRILSELRKKGYLFEK